MMEFPEQYSDHVISIRIQAIDDQGKCSVVSKYASLRTGLLKVFQ